jgi:hypothetical protein
MPAPRWSWGDVVVRAILAGVIAAMLTIVALEIGTWG